MKREFILYSKNNCHLCDEMQRQVEGLITDSSNICTVVKIDEDPDLVHRYGARVPVLEYANTIISEGKLDIQVFMKFLQEVPVSGVT